MSERQSRRQRSTTETNISIDLHVDGDGRSEVSTGLPFFDHMLAQLARHGQRQVDGAQPGAREH